MSEEIDATKTMANTQYLKNIVLPKNSLCSLNAFKYIRKLTIRKVMTSLKNGYSLNHDKMKTEIPNQK